MKFTDGYWSLGPGVTALYAHHAGEVAFDGEALWVYAPTAPIRGRGDTLNRPMITLRYSCLLYTSPSPRD